jgi:capsular polysaccharide biosynthesis protein
MFVASKYIISPEYRASAMFYVNNSSFAVGDTSLSISSGDLSTSRNLVDSYIVILNTRETLRDVIDYSGVNLSPGELSGMITAEAVNETEFFRVSVTCSDPVQAERIASAIAHVLPQRIGVIIDGTSARVAEAAVMPREDSSPSTTKCVLLGVIAGFVLTAAIIALLEIFDITICSEDDISRVCSHPILAQVPDMTAPSKGDSSYYGYGAGNLKKKKKGTVAASVKQSIIGPNISFAASEAYKLLRTKLQFSFSAADNCRVIGLSSALSGEGKSLTAVN